MDILRSRGLRERVIVHQPSRVFTPQGPIAGRFKVRLDFYPNSLEEILLMSRFASPKTARIWGERIALCERSNASVSQFCQSIDCSPTSYDQWKRKLAAKPQTSVFLRVLPRAHQGLDRDQTPRSRREAWGGRREGTAKQPENFGAIISRYPMITMQVARLARFR
jgi:hypothetical protein